MRIAVASKTSHSPPLRQTHSPFIRPKSFRSENLGSAKQMPDQRHYEENQENEEQDLRDARRRDGDACEAKQSRYQRNDEKCQRPTQHHNLLTGAT
jgi:hypothetical protein